MKTVFRGLAMFDKDLIQFNTIAETLRETVQKINAGSTHFWPGREKDGFTINRIRIVRED